jgi:signal transduction histidine kinase
VEAVPSAHLDRFAILVHEVRSPVAALHAIAAAYGGEELDTVSRRKLAGLAIAACRSIARIVSDASVASIVPADVDPSALVSDTAAAAALRGARVRAVVRGDIPRLRADPLRLRQALDNLVANAFVHAPGTDVVVEAAMGEGSILLTVTDNGDGIPLEQQAEIFAPGARLGGAGPGSGLGLAIARAIAEAHGGTLTVESQPGRGAAFTLALPIG